MGSYGPPPRPQARQTVASAKASGQGGPRASRQQEWRPTLREQPDSRHDYWQATDYDSSMSDWWEWNDYGGDTEWSEREWSTSDWQEPERTRARRTPTPESQDSRRHRRETYPAIEGTERDPGQVPVTSLVPPWKARAPFEGVGRRLGDGPPIPDTGGSASAGSADRMPPPKVRAPIPSVPPKRAGVSAEDAGAAAQPAVAKPYVPGSTIRQFFNLSTGSTHSTVDTPSVGTSAASAFVSDGEPQRPSVRTPPTESVSDGGTSNDILLSGELPTSNAAICRTSGGSRGIGRIVHDGMTEEERAQDRLNRETSVERWNRELNEGLERVFAETDNEESPRADRPAPTAGSDRAPPQAPSES